ncbi:hypothetical protein LIER_13411 [Lithospermum erythrorhizon]|uniref:Gnk2-homologous domain-containing protein n=1 Tax=Lithospermum erythrorhizon TaxID=34254 RepID=A0AAV3PWV6_LITER
MKTCWACFLLVALFFEQATSNPEINLLQKVAINIMHPVTYPVALMPHFLILEDNYCMTRNTLQQQSRVLMKKWYLPMSNAGTIYPLKIVSTALMLQTVKRKFIGGGDKDDFDAGHSGHLSGVAQCIETINQPDCLDCLGIAHDNIQTVFTIQREVLLM